MDISFILDHAKSLKDIAVNICHSQGHLKICRHSLKYSLRVSCKISSLNLTTSFINIHRFTVHTNLQDSHLYIVNKETLDQVLQDKSLTAVKGEMIPKLVSLQFNTSKGSKEEKMEMDNDLHGEKQKQRFGFY